MEFILLLIAFILMFLSSNVWDVVTAIDRLTDTIKDNREADDHGPE